MPLAREAKRRRARTPRTRTCRASGVRRRRRPNRGARANVRRNASSPTGSRRARASRGCHRRRAPRSGPGGSRSARRAPGALRPASCARTSARTTSASTRRVRDRVRQSGRPAVRRSSIRSIHRACSRTRVWTIVRSRSSGAFQSSSPGMSPSSTVRVAGSEASNGGTSAGSSAPISEMMPPSCVRKCGTVLHHTSPSAVGSRRTEDRFHVLICTTGPIRGRPIAARASSAHAIVAVTPPGRAHAARSGSSWLTFAPGGVSGSSRSGFPDQLGQVGDVASVVGLRRDIQDAEHDHLGGEALARGLRSRAAPAATTGHPP